MSTKSVINDNESVRTTTADIKSKIEQLARKSVTFEKKSGWFITKAAFDELEAGLDKAMLNGSTSVSPETLIDLQEQLAAMATRAQRAELELAAANTAATSLKEQLATGQAQLRQVQKEASDEKARLNLEKSALQKKLQPLEQAQKEARVRASDPDVVRERGEQISSLQKQLAVVNAAYAAEVGKVNATHAAVKNLEAELRLERLRADKARAASFEPKMVTVDEPLQELEPFSMDPEVTGALKLRFLDKESMAALAESAKARRENVREYAHSLLAVAHKRDPRNHIGYKDYLNLVFKKVKSTSARKRDRYMKLLDDVHDSFAFENSKKLKDIKDTYKTLFEPDSKESQANSAKVVSGSSSWWDDLLFDLKCRKIEAKLRWSIFKKESYTWFSLSSIRDKVRASYSTFKSWLPSFPFSFAKTKVD